jgi:hypothetical protein
MVSLISISIDSPLTMSWWVVKNVLYGSYCLTYYLIYGSKKQQTQEEINQMLLLLELKKELGDLDKKLSILTSDNNLTLDNNLTSDNNTEKLN